MEQLLPQHGDNRQAQKLLAESLASDSVDLHDLLFQIAELDEKRAFSLFFKLYHAKMLLLARIFVSSPQKAEDVVSDVLIKLLRNRRKTFNKKNFLGFLYTCIKNQSLDYLRKNKRHNHIKIDNNIDFLIHHRSDPCNHLMGKEFEEIVYECIENLPPRRKLVYKMIKDDQLSYKQVGELLDISVRTVEVQLRLAVKHLKITVDDYLTCSR
ncbi:MAG: DNA-directed RNA polymerase sigma-70 factor [Cyclobacteriaceae bacterium]|nr:MAG: DNA-directed RNA polymerase sigma-70 factor [Cyclobacteriaceae bacterium]